jgi:hypothetical protein
LRSTTRQVVNNGTPVTTFYVYDAGGQRIRKQPRNGQARAGPRRSSQSERVYLGGPSRFTANLRPMVPR